MSKKQYLVSFMPWAEPVKKELQIGPVSFWRFANQADSKIKEPAVTEYLTKYFKLYVDHKGNPVNTAIICSHGDINFRPLNEKDHTELRNAVDSLIFSIIAPQAANAVCMNNKFMGPPSSEVFQFFHQMFQPGKKSIHVKSGSLTMGWRTNVITFQKPWSTGGSWGTPDRELIAGFNKVFDPSFPKDIRDRIFRSLEWFRLAHVEIDEVPQLSKLIMMSTAFEIFLQFPERGQRRYFAEYMERNIASSEFKKDYRVMDQKERPKELSMAGCWAWDFYKLRSRIVHGDPISNGDLIYRDWITHLIVADLVFLELIKRKLYEHGCIGEGINYTLQNIFSQESEDSLKAKDIFMRDILEFTRVHAALGWLNKKKVKYYK